MDDKVYFISPDNTVTDLTDDVNYKVLAGRAGDFMPTFSFVDEKILSNQVQNCAGSTLMLEKLTYLWLSMEMVGLRLIANIDLWSD